MAEFDPAMRVETQFYQETGNKDGSGHHTFRRMGFNLVEYDGSREQYLEPINHELVPEGNANVVKFEVVKKSPLDEVHRFDF